MWYVCQLLKHVEKKYILFTQRTTLSYQTFQSYFINFNFQDLMDNCISQIVFINRSSVHGML